MTPRLELALDYAYQGGTLTFWYPKKTEFERITTDSTLPTIPLLASEKAAIIDKIVSSDLNEFLKESYLRIVEGADTIMPRSRLGAIASLGSNSWQRLLDAPSNRSNYLQTYVADRDKLVERREVALQKAKDITFFDPELTSRQLADDMVRTELEHYLLSIGRSLRFAQEDRSNHNSLSDYSTKELQRELEELQSVQFPEPLYERYRTTLTPLIEKFLVEK